MLADHQLLRIPGPSPIPPSVQRAMVQPMIGHRGQEAKKLIQTIRPKLKPIFGTDQDVVVITGSGTAGLETAVVNTVKAGDEVLVIVTGSFGDRFAKICESYQIRVRRLDVEWGNALDPNQVKVLLEENPTIKAVFATFCETSTGVLNPIQALSEMVHQSSDALLVVDGVSCIGGVDTKMDEWGIDILVTGSQKAFMLPAGLTFVAASERAWNVIENNEQSRFYLDLKKYRDNLIKDSTPFTPALSLLFGLEQVLQLFEEEGLSNVFKRHQTMMEMTRAAANALKLPLLTSDVAASPTVTAIRPADFQAEDLRKVLKQEFALSVAGGQQHLKGKIFRIGHMGYCAPADILQIVAILEIALKRIGKNVPLGSGTAAAQEVYLKKEAY
ncbi:pyridoxal-phosphate-dependent aminotransferase family protein [Terrihalobacillus insolitus]|uniref:pyridoxal-phosphate-dependent aminotransferase family protein n=1 Tax=Terrihalobacillus insolitus TaxID=2950438 RepID=UPI00233F8C5C|nr:alanine--glyoxylate aminotransferase family protein [Terrihalobacillus insolitus]MDC3415048.1 alanine--glyoxylate aminotransferase family protein [Terrihalobacillus insolitus]